MAKKDSTKVYIEFEKNDLSAVCKKLSAALDEANKVAGMAREAYVKQVERDHGKAIKDATPNGYVYIGIGTNFGKLSGIYDLPGAAKKSSSKAVSLK
jgi:hypothetical protein